MKQLTSPTTIIAFLAFWSVVSGSNSGSGIRTKPTSDINNRTTASSIRGDHNDPSLSQQLLQQRRRRRRRRQQEEKERLKMYLNQFNRGYSNSTSHDDEQLNNDSSFYDFDDWDQDLKRSFVKSILTFNKASSTIDWDKIRDMYTLEIIADFEDDEVQNIHSSSSSVLDKKADLSSSRRGRRRQRRRRLTSTPDETQKDDEVGKDTYNRLMKKKKKKKKKSYKQKNNQSSPSSSSSSLLANVNTANKYLSNNNAYSHSYGKKVKKSKKKKGKSKKYYSDPYTTSPSSSSSRMYSTYGGVTCINRSVYNAYQLTKMKSKKSKGKGGDDQYYYYYGRQLETKVKKTKTSKKNRRHYYKNRNFGLNTYFSMSKRIKMKQKSKKESKTITLQSPSQRTSPQSNIANDTNDTSYWSYQSASGEGSKKSSKSKKSKKSSKYSYPFCDELETPSPTTRAPIVPTVSPTRAPLKIIRRTETPVTVPGTKNKTTSIPTDFPSPNPDSEEEEIPPSSPTGTPPQVTPQPTKQGEGTEGTTPQPTTAGTPQPTEPPTRQPTLEPGIYRYSNGNCPNPGSEGIPCAEDLNLRRICDRYHPLGSFRKCYEICRDSFCCIHDADPVQNYIAPSCSKDENCAQYAYCYIVWFKFHDTFGPATYLNVEQDGNFFDVANSEVTGDRFGQDEFFDQLYFHHFDNITKIFEGGRDDNGQFQGELIFEEPQYWDGDV